MRKADPGRAEIKFLFTMEDVEELHAFEKENPEEIYRISELGGQQVAERLLTGRI